MWDLLLDQILGQSAWPKTVQREKDNNRYADLFEVICASAVLRSMSLCALSRMTACSTSV